MTLLVTEKNKKPNKVFNTEMLRTEVCFKKITLILCSKEPEGKQEKSQREQWGGYYNNASYR